jgi:hypothetical protein
MLLVSAASICSAGPVQTTPLPAPAINAPAPRFANTDAGPDAWALWNRLSEDELPPAGTSLMESAAHAESTPVAPMPPALLTGGSVLLAGGILRLTRKLRLR